MAEENFLREQVLNSLQNVLCLEKVHNTAQGEIINRLIERLSDKSFRVAVVGEFSSGKSTFLNALMGRDILKHGAVETTATITEIVNSPSVNANIYDIYFRDGKVISDVPIQDLEAYTVASSKICDVAKDIRKVVIRSHIIDSDMPIVFVDTPGLNGIADRHREQTIEQIEQAHACIYLIQARGLTKSDLDFICDEIGNYQNTFLFVQNFIDELSALEGESAEDKLREQKEIIEKRIKLSNADMTYEIVGISAKEALLARDYAITTNEGIELTEVHRRNLLEKSRFNDVLNALLLMMENNQKSAKQERDTCEALLNILEDMKQAFNDRSAELTSIKGKGDIKQKIDKLIARFNENREKNKCQLESFIVNETDQIKKLCQSRIGIYVDEARQDITKKIDECDSFSQLSDYMDINVKSDLNRTLKPLRDDLRKIMSVGFENLIATAVLRIQQYTSVIDEKDIKRAGFGSLELVEIDYRRDESDLEKRKRELERLNIENDKMEQQIAALSQQQEKSRQEAQVTKNEKQQAQNQYHNKLRNLGNRPEAREWTETVTRTRERTGFFGSIAQFFVGDEEYEEEVTHYDTSNQEAWDREKARINNDFAKKNEDLARKERLLQAKLSEYEYSKFNLGHDIKQNRQSAESLVKLIKEKEERIRVEKEKAKAEAMRNAKRQAKQQIETYLVDELEPSLASVCRKQLDSARDKDVKRYIMETYEESCQSRLQELNRLQTKNGNDSEDDVWKSNAAEVSKAIDNLKALMGRKV